MQFKSRDLIANLSANEFPCFAISKPSYNNNKIVIVKFTNKKEGYVAYVENYLGRTVGEYSETWNNYVFYRIKSLEQFLEQHSSDRYSLLKI